MAEHRETHTISGPFPDFDPLDTALLFLRSNRYRLVQKTEEAPPAALEVDRTLLPDMGDEDAASADAPVEQADDDAAAEPEAAAEICVFAELERGDKWSGILSSSMSELPTTLTLRLTHNIIRVEYVVTTTGQLLSDAEREFWRTEARALEHYLKGEGELVSLASLEEDRASSARRDRLSAAFWLACIVFFIVFVGGVMLSRM